MKRFITLQLVLFSFLMAIYSQATDLVIDCQTPGMLSSIINATDQQSVKNLKVTGELNADDMHFIGGLMQNYQLHGRVDLSDVNVDGYKMDSRTNDFGLTSSPTFTIDYLALPKSLTGIGNCLASYFSKYSTYYLKVDTLYFAPDNFNYVKASFFDGRQFESSINHLILGEKIDSIPDNAFCDKGGVSSLELPVGMKYIGEKAFYENYNSVKNVNFNELINLKYLGPDAFPRGYQATSYYNPDTLIIPKTLSNPFYFCAFSYRDGQHIFFDNNINEISVGYNPFRNLIFHINNSTPPLLSNYSGSISRYFESTTVYVPKGAKQAYMNSDWKYANIIEFIPPTTYTLSIKATGNGSVTYNGTSVRGKTSTFTINDGASATITFTPDNGYRIKSLKVNNTDVTSSITNNAYTISSITKDTSVEVVFEAITHTLSIKATGNGSATYSGTSVRGKTSTFTVNDGASATITFTPDNGYRIKSVKVNNTDVTSSITNNAYTINSIVEDTFVEVVFEAITHTLSIKATGNGSATYSGTTVRGKTSTFAVNEGTSATITFTPDDGNRIKSLKVNNTDVTSSITNNAYTISSITKDTSVEVVFEATPTYTLKITSTGNGSASYNGSAVRAKTSSFTVYEGASVTVVFTPDNGYRIANVKVNDQDVTAGVNNNRYTISSITANTTMSVTFEEIPATTYSLSITATGNGSVTYNNTTLKNQTQAFTVTEGSYATIAISPESGYRIKSVVQNGADVTTSVDNNQYTTNKITGNTTLEVTFESIPITIYTLSVTASGNGTVNCLNKTIKNQTESFDIEEGASATITFSPDNGNSVDKVKVNGTDVSSQASGNRYVIESMSGNTTIEVSFKEDVNAMTVAGVNYIVTSQNEKTIVVAGGNYGKVLIVPATISQNGTTWKIMGIEEGALNNNSELAAIIWNPEVAFTSSVSNPNLLLYVKNEQYAPTTIQNVIVNGTANSIVLTDAGSGNNFYCPQAFTALQISYTHNYQMQTGVDEVKGWETIALPFAVQTISHDVKGAIKPFAAWSGGESDKPFWLYELTGSGFVAANSIQAYTPYIISMPNNPQYDSEWLLNGNVTFAASSVTIEKTEDVQKPSYKDRTFVPCFETMGAGEGLYALNVRNQYETNNSGMPDGSMFVLNMRKVHPFEAYLTTSSAARQFAISIFDGMTTDIPMIESVKMLSKGTAYDLQGRKITHTSKKGVYIVNGKKIIK